MSAEETKISFGKSKEEIALELLRYIAISNGKSLKVKQDCDQNWILQTYKQCLNAVSGDEISMLDVL